MRLSLCMIVKNEAATLDRCLASARPHVDEVVIIDTGSTDETPVIARAYADVFDQIAWPNSFARARNYSFDLARGTYLLWLDGDEYLPDEQHWATIRALAERDDIAGAQLNLRNTMRPDQVVASDHMRMIRLVRNHPSMRFVGRVHNQIDEALLAYAQRTSHRIVNLDAEIIHTGYALDVDGMRAKYAPRIALLEAEVAVPRSPEYGAYYGYQLGLGYFLVERYDEAADVLAAVDDDCLLPDNAFYTRLLGVQVGLRRQDVTGALQHADAMLTLRPTDPMALFLTGLALLQAQEIRNGLLMVTEAYQQNAHADGERFRLNEAVVLQYLAQTCQRVGLTSFAESFLSLIQGDEVEAEAVLEVLTTLRQGLVLTE